MSLQVRRHGNVIVAELAGQSAAEGCGTPVDLVVPAPRLGQGPPASHGFLVQETTLHQMALERRTFRTRAAASDGRVDRDRFTFQCGG